MDISKYTSGGGFLKASDVLASPNIPFVVLGEGELTTSEKFGTEKLNIPGEFKALPVTLSLSKTNARFVSDALGKDTKKWIGKQLFLETYKTKTSEGKMVDAINIKRIE